MKMLYFKFIARTMLSSIFLTITQAIEPTYMPLDSVFRPTGQNVETMVVLDSIRVYTGTQAGKDLIGKLKSNGYACQPALSQLWRCTRHLSNWNHDTTKVQKRILEKVAQLPDISFGKVWSEPEQTHESEAYNEWEMRQKVKVGEYSSDYFRFRSLAGTSYLKLLPGQQGSKEEYLWNGEKLSRVIEFSMSHKEGYTRYLFEIPYQ